MVSRPLNVNMELALTMVSRPLNVNMEVSFDYGVSSIKCKQGG